MPSAPSSATPDVMMLLCVIGRAMRGIGPSHVGMQLMLIGALCPSFGGVLRTWLDLEEHVATAPDPDEPWWGCDDDEDDGELRSGWLSRTGAVWRWRQVSRTGIVTAMLVRWFEAQPNPAWLRRGAVWAPGCSVSPVIRSFVFCGWFGRPAGLRSYCYDFLMNWRGNVGAGTLSDSTCGHHALDWDDV